MKFLARSFVLVLALLAALGVADAAQSGPAENAALPDPGPIYGARLEGFDYPWPVALYRFQSQGKALEMAYMDVKPARPTGRVAVLLHGKNFCAASLSKTAHMPAFSTIVEAVTCRSPSSRAKHTS